MFSRAAIARNSKIALPIAVGSIGLAYYCSNSFNQSIYNETGKTFTNPNDWIDLKLKSSADVGHSSKKLIFELNDANDVSGLVNASCLLTKFVTAKGNNVIRPYTPISDVDQKGIIEFVIKRYDGGKMSSHIHDLKPNDTLSFKGPIVKWKWEPNQYKSIDLLGGGSGITPLYQLLHEVTKNPDDKTKVNLYYGSVDQDDILLKPELDDIANKYKDQVKIVYFLDKAPADWTGESGFITKDYLQKNLSGPSKDNKVFICGPPGLYKALSGMKNSPTDQGEVTGALAELGYTKEHVYKF